MSKWEKFKLGEIMKITSGGTPPKSNPDYYKNGTIPWVRTGDLKDKYITEVQGRITEEALKRSSAKLLPSGTVLVAMYGATIGACSILTVEATTNQACAAFLPDSRINSSFLYYFLLSKKNDLIKMGVGGAQPNISAAILKEIKFPLPSLEEQKQIAKTLYATTELQDMHKQQLVELENLIKTTFYVMFGDPIKNPFGFMKVKLGDIGVLNSGGTPSRSNPKYFLGDIDWYAAGELNQRYLMESKEKLTTEAITKSAAKIFKKGSMLIGMYDTAAFKLGILTKDASSNQACANIDVNRDIVNIEWLYDCAQIMRPFFLNNRRGVRQKNLNLGMIRNFEVPLPPIELQNKFAEIVTKIEEQKALVKKAIDETQQLFDSLMSRYFDD